MRASARVNAPLARVDHRERGRDADSGNGPSRLMQEGVGGSKAFTR